MGNIIRKSKESSSEPPTKPIRLNPPKRKKRSFADNQKLEKEWKIELPRK